jgi:hypothetical protein
MMFFENPFRWLMRMLVVYLAAALTAGALFVVAAAIISVLA